MSYERGDIEIWLDPDEPVGFFDEELEAILSNTEFYLTFSSEISNLKVLNDIEIRDTKVLNTLKKQIFVGAITCLETYLTDAFINTVLSEKEYLKSFFLSFNIFKEQSIKMSALFDTFDKAEEIAKEKMSEVLYHNIPKVKQMYKTTLNISFPEIGKIAKYVSQRHDLIHRNGKNKKGDSLFVNKADVEKVISDIEAFVNTIDKQLKDKEKKTAVKNQ